MSAPAIERPQQAPAPAQAKPDGNATLLAGILDRVTEFVPFMGKESIRLTPRSVMQYLCNPTKKGLVCDERQAQRFVMLCKARGLNPWEGDAFIIGYDGQDGPSFSLITAHQAFLKRAEVHPEYDGMESGVFVRRKDGNLVELHGDWFDETDQILGGWARVHFKNRSVPMYKRLKLATFSTGRSRWNADPAGMIVKCCEADALRSAFPNTLGGMYLDDEMPREAVVAPAEAAAEVAEPAPKQTKTEVLAAKLGAKPVAENGHPKEPTASEELLAKIASEVRRLGIGEVRVKEILKEFGAKSMGHLTVPQGIAWLARLEEQPSREPGEDG